MTEEGYNTSAPVSHSSIHNLYRFSRNRRTSPDVAQLKRFSSFLYSATPRKAAGPGKSNGARTGKSPKHLSAGGAPHYQGYTRLAAGSPQALAILTKARWQSTKQDFPESPQKADRAISEAVAPFLEVLLVPRECVKRRRFLVHDDAYQAERNPHRIHQSTAAVFLPDLTLINVYITGETLPSVAAIAAGMRKSTPIFHRNYPTKQRKFAVHARWTPERGKHKDRYYGLNWLDGMQTFSSAGRNGNGKSDGIYVRHHKRNPDMSIGDLTKISSIYTGIQSIERMISPEMYRRRRAIAKHAPEAFPGVPHDIAPFTAVGMSQGFGVNSHRDSSRRGTAETILWDGNGVDHAVFTICEMNPPLCFDIGSRPAVMIMDGKLEHGTMGSSDQNIADLRGAVIMSKTIVTACRGDKSASCRGIQRFKDLLKDPKANLDALRGT